MMPAARCLPMRRLINTHSGTPSSTRAERGQQHRADHFRLPEIVGDEEDQRRVGDARADIEHDIGDAQQPERLVAQQADEHRRATAWPCLLGRAAPERSAAPPSTVSGVMHHHDPAHDAHREAIDAVAERPVIAGTAGGDDDAQHVGALAEAGDFRAAVIGLDHFRAPGRIGEAKHRGAKIDHRRGEQQVPGRRRRAAA